MIAALRFWPKFEFPWLIIPIVLVEFDNFYTHRGHPDFQFALSTVGLMLLPVIGIASYRTTYWELTSSHLLDCRFWRKHQISWNEVTEVRWTGKSTRTLCVGVGLRTEDYKWLYFTPKDKTGVIAALRQFAPHAKFDLDPALDSLSLQCE